MASSISITSRSTYEGRIMTLSCTQTRNITSNTSTINWTLTTSGGEVNWYATGPTTVTINNTQVYYAERSKLENVFPTAKGSVSGTLTVSHNADGSKSIPVSLSTAIYYVPSASHPDRLKTDSATWELDSIPRQATIASASYFNDENNPTLTYSNPAGNNVTTLQAALAFDYSNFIVPYTDVSKTGSTVTFNLTDTQRSAIRAKSISSRTTSVPVLFLLKTVIGGVEYIAQASRTCSIVNADISGTLRLTLDSKTTRLTGSNTIGIKGFTEVSAEINALTYKGASVSSYNITNGSTSFITRTATFEEVTNGNFTWSVTDSRNTVASGTSTITLVDYIKPTCNVDGKIRISSNDSTRIAIEFTVKGNYFNGSFGASSNRLELIYSIDEEPSVSMWLPSSAFNGNTYEITIDTGELDYNIDYREPHVVEVVVVDALYTVVGRSKSLKAIPTFDWSDEDFAFNVPVTIQGASVPTIEAQGTDGIWTYRKWSDGTAECWGTKAITATFPTTANWGTMFTSGALSSSNVYFPIGLFIETPSVSANLVVTNLGGFLMSPGVGGGWYATTKETTGSFEIARATAVTGSPSFTISYQVKGRWK